MKRRIKSFSATRGEKNELKKHGRVGKITSADECCTLATHVFAYSVNAVGEKTRQMY